jgi:3'-phosphoadenosine 5'-phosphosulfate sulfotransferase (PAPS reductase)/FAD synthetase
MRPAEQVIAEALAGAKDPCITSSFQAEDVVVVHMVREVRPDIPVLFLDTFHHFAETLTYRDELTARWGLNLVNVRAPAPTVGLWQTSTDDCCARHKVGPLFAALEPYDVWFTGLRREQSPSRANLAEVETFRLPSGKPLAKISPLRTMGREEARVRHPHSARRPQGLKRPRRSILHFYPSDGYRLADPAHAREPRPLRRRPPCRRRPRLHRCLH